MQEIPVNGQFRAIFVGMFALLFSIVLISPLSLSGQQSTGATVTGTALDPHGNVIQNAGVVVRNEATGYIHKTTTDGEGHFSVSGLSVAKYTVEISAPGFAIASRTGLQLTEGQTQDIPVTLSIGSATQEVTVEAAATNSVAAQLAPLDAPLDSTSARTEISAAFIQNFTSPMADYGELVQYAPGTFTTSSDGVGLGQSKTYFRGFPDGDYDIDFDGLPFYDTNSPSHHSWAFFPSQWIGGVDFDRSPGSASTIGPTPFGGSIHLLSRELSPERDVRGSVTYGSFNTIIYDGQFDSGNFGFGGPPKSNLFMDVHRMTSDGFQTYNNQMQNAGSIKYQYRFSDQTVLTGYSGVIHQDASTPNFSSTRCQTLGASPTGAWSCSSATLAPFAGSGIQFLMTNNSDPVNWLDQKYNVYHVLTDFEYVGFKTAFGKSWSLDVKPYTYNYDNAELYSNATPITEATTVNGSSTYNGVAIAPCNVPVTKKGVTAIPCGVDKYNSYRKYGETLVVSQTSKLGVFRTGLWYEWAATNRHQYPTDPLNNWADQALPNFAEQFWTNSYQPYGEFEFHATNKLNITPGVKLAYYTIALTQHADDGKTVGPLTGPTATVNNSTSYTAWLPSLVANYRVQPNFSIYGQVATGSIVPPSSVFDVNQTVSSTAPAPEVAVTPKQQRSTTYQAGGVIKLPKATLDVDMYSIRFQNSYSSVTDTVTTDSTFGDAIYFLQPSSITKGFEAESNIAFTHSLSVYLNGNVDRATYSGSLNAGTFAAPYYQTAPPGLWVSQTPTDTETEGVTYQQKFFDIGILNKRVGTQHVDNGSYHNQALIDAFSVTNLFFNYTIRNGSHFDQTKFRLSFNNLFNQSNLTTLTLTGAAPTQLIAGTKLTDLFATNGTTAPAGADNVGFLPGRSINLSVTFGYAPKR